MPSIRRLCTTSGTCTWPPPGSSPPPASPSPHCPGTASVVGNGGRGSPPWSRRWWAWRWRCPTTTQGPPSTMSPNRPSDTEVDRLDPYAFMALVGKRVIHPGGRRSTAEMCQFARFEPGQQVVDVGCGVATTAVEVARRFRCHVTAVDIDPLVLGRAIANARAADVANVTVAKADIQALEFPDAAIDRVLNEC